MALIYSLLYISFVLSALALILEFIFTKRISKWFFVYLLSSFLGGLIFSFITLGDSAFFMEYNFISTDVAAVFGAGIFVYFSLLLKNRLAKSLGERFSRKVLGLYIFLIFVVLLVIVSLKANQSPDFIKKEIERANYCDTKDDCAQLNAKCPFGCYVYVNNDEASRILDLINTFESKCVYDCIEAPNFDCVDRKCITVEDGFNDRGEDIIDSFEKCVEAGNPIIESYPRQCQSDNETFTEGVGNELEKLDLIRINTPRPNEEIESPLKITGEARGGWYFEASFPIILTNWDGLIIAEGFATAQGDWMTEDFVPFEAEITFDNPSVYNRGALILQKDNPSGLSEYDDALEIPIKFKYINN